MLILSIGLKALARSHVPSIGEEKLTLQPYKPADKIVLMMYSQQLRSCSALIEWGTGWRVDGYIGLLIALYILFSGIMMIRTFINELLGARPTEAEIREMEDRLDRYPTILGVP